MDKNKLKEVLNLPDDDDESSPIEYDVKIPENPTLDDITRITLEAYKDQMNDIMHIEPRHRARALEVAEKFLNLAKESLVKKEDLAIKKEKQTVKKEEEDGLSSQKSRTQVLQELELVEGGKK